MAGALDGIRIIEFSGLGPAPFCGMMLADHGAEVICIQRPGGYADARDPLARSRRSISLDIKRPEAVEVARALCRTADGIIEGYRPGVMERLGLGPDVLLADNPKLVYGRMTGWGQDGPYAQAAGHDINYIALSGVLHGIGPAGKCPQPPANYLGDFGGGGMMLAFGMVSALLAVKMGGAGQVIDCAMTEGSALLAAQSWYLQAIGMNEDRAGVNPLDGGAPYYNVYECADGKYVALGSLEEPFYAELREKAGLSADPDFDRRGDKAMWPLLKEKLAATFRQRTRDEWCALMEGSDACFAPVLSRGEAPHHPHNVAREVFIELNNVVQPGPAPRFSGTPAPPARPGSKPGADTEAVLAELGYDAARISATSAAIAEPVDPDPQGRRSQTSSG